MSQGDATNRGQVVPNIPTGGQPTGTTATFDTDLGPIMTLDLSGAGGNVAITFQNMVALGIYTLLCLTGGTPHQILGSGTPAIKFAGGAAPTFGASSTNILTFLYDGTNFLERSRSLGDA